MPHALLFSGPQGVGKKQAALATAAAFLCLDPKDGLACGECASCKALAAGTHPDFFAVLPETSGKAARSVKIEQIREMRGAVARTPKFSTRRAVLLDDAETMNDAAANALLKTLEEPPGDTLFLLVTTFISSMKVFQSVDVMTSGGPHDATMVMVQWVYNLSFKDFRIDRAASASLVFFIILLGFTVLTMRYSNKSVNYDQ